jgi:hypothetical protein
LHLPELNYDRAHQQYVDYLMQMHRVAGIIHALPDQIEWFLYSKGRTTRCNTTICPTDGTSWG